MALIMNYLLQFTMKKIKLQNYGKKIVKIFIKNIDRFKTFLLRFVKKIVILCFKIILNIIYHKFYFISM